MTGRKQQRAAGSRERAGRSWYLLLAAALLLAHAVQATTPAKKQKAREQFDRAESARKELESKSPDRRRLADYQTLVRLYRSVYLWAPTIRQAPESVFRVAELSREMADLFAADKNAARFLADARKSYQMLVREYPEHRLRSPANRALAQLDATPAPAPPATAEVAPASEKTARDPAEPGKTVAVTGIRQWATPNYTRVVIDLEDEVKFEAGRIPDPDRIFFDLHNTKPVTGLSSKILEGEDGLLKKVRLGVNRAGLTRVVLEVGQVGTYSAFLLPNPYRLVIDIQGARTSLARSEPPPRKTADPKPTEPQPAEKDKPVETAAVRKLKQEERKAAAPPPASTPLTAPAAERIKSEGPTEPEAKPKTEQTRTEPVEVAAATPTGGKEVPSTKGPSSQPVYEKVRPATPPRPLQDGHRSLTRALGLKIGRIVIDPGHGGHDTGSIGPTGYAEKDLVLDVARRLGALVEDRLGSEVIYTREDDNFVPLEARTAIANQKQADLFVSVHANASRDPRARGIETYYLSFSTSSEALEVAARENAVSDKSIHELQDLVKKITLNDKVDESREFAGEIQKQLHATLSRGNSGLRNRGVRKAPFIVLIGANMPSILAEISFVTNPQDERLLKKPEYRQKVAESLFRGIQRYATALGGVRVASRTTDLPN